MSSPTPPYPEKFKTTKTELNSLSLLGPKQPHYEIDLGVDPLHSYAWAVQWQTGILLEPKLAHHLLTNLHPCLNHPEASYDTCVREHINHSLQALTGANNSIVKG